MPVIKITSKRQATLPKALCDQLHLAPGDSVALEPKKIDGEWVWVMKPAREIDASWFGALNRYARGKKHDMASIRRSIERARQNADL